MHRRAPARARADPRAQAVSAALMRWEVASLRLYTGPMYDKYNAVLRGFPKEHVEALAGNKYTATLHTVQVCLCFCVYVVCPCGRKEQPVRRAACVRAGLRSRASLKPQ